MNPYDMRRPLPVPDAKTLEALSAEQLAEMLAAWQHALADVQGRVVEIAMGLYCLQQEQVSRQHLATLFGPKAEETPQQSEPKSARILSFVRPPQVGRKN